MDRILKYRRLFVVAVHLALVVLANYLAFWLRFDGAIPERELSWFGQMLPILVAIRGLVFIPFHIYQGVWRYTGIWDLRNIITSVLVSTLGFYVLTHLGFGLTGYPRSVFLIDSILLIFALGGIRLVCRIYREFQYHGREKSILVYGAGDAGEMIVRELRNNRSHEYEPIGFVDDDPTKLGRRIHGVRVLGGRNDLAMIISKESLHGVLIAMPNVKPAALREIVKELEPFKLPIKTLPNLRDVLNGKAEFSQIRNLSVEDLLERSPVGLDLEPLRHLIEGKRILVTGAGGSIGSELCRQIASLQPASLVLYERYENGLYAVSNELASRYSSCPIYPIVGDVTDEKRVDVVIAEQRPKIIFHAAAHKHVPLMELNPCEAVKNNVFGTRVVATAAAQHAVERFILISSDKAVNPLSVMGATKRAAELLIQSMSRNEQTIFATVRFGNVLASNGSVVPLFLEQIKAGGPVTVTHPDMKRYFMLIHEAVQLVLFAAALANGGEIFVLEMGEQITILELARNLIRLSGFVPEKEIPIIFTGLRPGEKLSEELAGKDETVEPTVVEKVLHVRSGWSPDPNMLMRRISGLERMALAGDAKAVIEHLQRMAEPDCKEFLGANTTA